MKSGRMPLIVYCRLRAHCHSVFVRRLQPRHSARPPFIAHSQTRYGAGNLAAGLCYFRGRATALPLFTDIFAASIISFTPTLISNATRPSGAVFVRMQ